ncbi:hypothetical protein F4561_005988 [Lipingzhangella halophila]|uniref:Uncharacterized protein n=1 Tax=Lipingzhangella halophila TaxID=1783352 RepID=A0A7W7RN86_9ACTN|nr:hypothetical protein [Lipingzhangella halophila]
MRALHVVLEDAVLVGEQIQQDAAVALARVADRARGQAV